MDAQGHRGLSCKLEERRVVVPESPTVRRGLAKCEGQLWCSQADAASTATTRTVSFSGTGAAQYPGCASRRTPKNLIVVSVTNLHRLKQITLVTIGIHRLASEKARPDRDECKAHPPLARKEKEEVRRTPSSRIARLGTEPDGTFQSVAADRAVGISSKWQWRRHQQEQYSDRTGGRIHPRLGR